VTVALGKIRACRSVGARSIEISKDAEHAEYANENDPGTCTYMQANRVSHNIILDGKFFISRSASIAITPSNDDREVSRNDLQNSCAILTFLYKSLENTFTFQEKYHSVVSLSH